MHKFFRQALFGLLAVFAASGQEAVHTSTVTVSAGGEVPTANYFGESSGPIFNGNYEFRMWKYLALETGVDNMLPGTETYEYSAVFFPGPSPVPFQPPYAFAFVAIPGRTRVTLLPFGVKGILPLAGGRVELFAGFGGAYDFHADDSHFDSFLMRESLGGRFALDRKRHYWVGTSGQFFSNWGGNRQEWLSWTADFGLRFGR